MEYTKAIKVPHIANKLIQPETEFLNELNTINPIYLFGSILRGDYFPFHSDIDIVMFDNNLESIIAKLVIFLGINKSNIKVVRLESKHNKTHHKTVIKGFKTNYVLNFEPVWFKSSKRFEISIFDVKYKQIVLSRNNKHLKMPIFSSLALLIFKFLYYLFPNFKIYKKMMNKVKDYLMDKNNDYTNKISKIATL